MYKKVSSIFIFTSFIEHDWNYPTHHSQGPHKIIGYYIFSFVWLPWFPWYKNEERTKNYCTRKLCVWFIAIFINYGCIFNNFIQFFSSFNFLRFFFFCLFVWSVWMSCFFRLYLVVLPPCANNTFFAIFQV